MSGHLTPAKLNADTAVDRPAAPAAPAVAQEWPGLASTEGSDKGVHWARYIAAVKRYKWLILVLTAIGTAVGIILMRFYTPEFTASAAVMITADQRAQRSGPIEYEDPLEIGDWVMLLTSRAMIDQIVHERHLYIIPNSHVDSSTFDSFTPTPGMATGSFVLRVAPGGDTFTLATDDGTVVDRGQVGDTIGRPLGWQWVPSPSVLPAGGQIAFQIIPPDRATSALKDWLQVAPPPRGSNTLQLRLTALDPQLAASNLNALLRAFERKSLELKTAQFDTQMTALQKQVSQAEAQLHAKEQEYQQYLTQIITLPTRDQTPVPAGLPTTTGSVMGEYFAMKQQAGTLSQDASQLEKLAQQARAGQTTPIDAFRLVPSAQNTELMPVLDQIATAQDSLRRLLLIYTPQHPAVQTLQRDLHRLQSETLPQVAEQTAAQLRSRVNLLQSQVAETDQELRQIPARSTRERQLERDRNLLEQQYLDARSRYNQALLAKLSTTSDVQVVDPAVPPRMPSNLNQTWRLLVMAIMASLAGGVGLAILLDHMDPRVRYPEQVTGELGLAVLGAVPTIRSRRNGETDPEEAAQVIEAFRTIRLNVTHAFAGVGPITLTISSPGAGDGKSMISANLALSFAEAGYRTLLVDGDTRRGELHAMFGLNRRPGLTDHLSGEVPLDVVLRETTYQNLTVIPCGTRRHSGPELLVSEALVQLLDLLRTRYDTIIVDSPPLGAGVDPFLLGTATKNMMLVFRTGVSDRKMADSKLQLVDRLPVRVVGAVLNDVRAEGVYRYYSYLYGYTSADEDSPRIGSGVGELTRTP
ncbi:MAG TPA: polysaccharide biosynthesis tyrosine autokinase [Gemmatimonadaceae bacterium]|nr:polysaccharide biosynthesis tyrosine autokinase [Gemmatimonadaceae bacterium]